jgi:hypothetical protein
MVDTTPPSYYCAPHNAEFVNFEMAKQLKRTLYFINLHGFYNSKGQFGILDENLEHYQAPTYAQIFQCFEKQLHLYTRFYATYPSKYCAYNRKYRYTMRIFKERDNCYENLLASKKYSPYFKNIEDAQLHAANYLVVVYKYMERHIDYKLAYLDYIKALEIIAEDRGNHYKPSIIKILELIEKIKNN